MAKPEERKIESTLVGAGVLDGKRRRQPNSKYQNDLFVDGKSLTLPPSSTFVAPSGSGAPSNPQLSSISASNYSNSNKRKGSHNGAALLGLESNKRCCIGEERNLKTSPSSLQQGKRFHLPILNHEQYEDEDYKDEYNWKMGYNVEEEDNYWRLDML